MSGAAEAHTLMDQPAGKAAPGRGAGRMPRLLEALAAFGGALVLLEIATVPLQPRQQAILAVLSALVFLVVNRFKGRLASAFLVVLSLAVSLRYIVWRATDTLGFESVVEVILGSLLVAAEAYAVSTLILGYLQTLWPLRRKPVALPDDVALWPTVDVFIPTYNEDLEIVRVTVMAATRMDWPRDKLRVHILDDGRREEFRRFAERAGVNYITRRQNQHAKAGNLNHAMSKTDGAFICVFDADHIPNRAFLQMTMGWLLREPRLAMVQTPHHFYSPDPFQRNLAAGRRVPPEGNLFYGLIRDGNDFWNACFFCGSCAVLRRSALEQIGGFAVETVTEDAHTMLKLHRRGWESAYLRIPLAAGLATERLARHIGQRKRWARGMIQIFRRDNPLAGRGLSLAQRLCYLQAAGHFFFAIPRVIFLTAPLMFLMFGQNLIAASPLAILAYALPHVFHSMATNSRLQGRWRYSFWSEIYETVLALHLVRLTLVTLIAPSRGKFNVTAKGGTLETGYFDLRAVWPNAALTALLLLGVGRGVGQLLLFQNDTLTFQALLLNSIWAFFNLLIVMVALAVAREARQPNAAHPVRARVPVIVYLPDGRVLTGTSSDLSLGGCRAALKLPGEIADGTMLDVEFSVVGGEPLLVPSRLAERDDEGIRIAFDPATAAEEANCVEAVFGRADAWADWDSFPKDRPFASLWGMLVSIRALFRRPGRDIRARRAGTREAVGSLAMALLLLFLPRLAAAEAAGTQVVVRPVPQPVATLPQAAAAPAGAPSPAAADPARPDAADAGIAQGHARQLTLTLRELGAAGPLALRGTSELQGVQFGIRADEVVTAAKLTLSGAMSPALIPEFSNVTVTLNEQYVGTVPVDAGHPRFDNMAMPVDPVFFQDSNRLNFRLTGRYTRDCNDPLSGLLWSTVSDTSTLTLTLERLPPRRNLALLPRPFFDPNERQKLLLPFVVPATASNETLHAAAIAASWFGQLADYRGASFPVSAEAPLEGNAVVIVAGQDRPAGVTLPAIEGPTLAVIPNPNDGNASLLVIAGRNGAEAAQAAAALAISSRAQGGEVARVASPEVAPRKPYDAPYWIPTDRPVRFGELVSIADLQATGYAGTVRVPFRTAPDLYTWRRRPFPAVVEYRAPPGPVVDVAVSRFDTSINGVYLASQPMVPRESWFARLTGAAPPQPRARVDVPVYDVFGQNELQFFFDARPLHRGDCVAIPGDLHMGIDPGSTIDLSDAYRFTVLPNLALFVGSGFPFTRMADLSDTAVVLPERPGTVELEAFLTLMGRIGSLTGYPALRLAVVRPAGVTEMADRDLLLIGTFAGLRDAGSLLAATPFRLDGGRLQVTFGGVLDTIQRIFSDTAQRMRNDANAQLLAAVTPDSAAIAASESPLRRGRSLVALVAATPQGLHGAVAMLSDSKQAPRIQGDLAIVSGGQATSWRVGGTYTVGYLPPWIWPSWYLRNSPVGVMAFMLAGAALLSLVLFRMLRRHAAVRRREL